MGIIEAASQEEAIVLRWCILQYFLCIYTVYDDYLIFSFLLLEEVGLVGI